MSQPPPHLITKSKPEIDPAPPEPNPNASPEKRGIGEDDYSDFYYAAKLKPEPPSPNERPSRTPQEWWRYPGGSSVRPEYMCSNEFMETTGVKPIRGQWNRKFTPENPWQRKNPERVERKKPGRKPKPKPKPTLTPSP